MTDLSGKVDNSIGYVGQGLKNSILPENLGVLTDYFNNEDGNDFLSLMNRPFTSEELEKMFKKYFTSDEIDKMMKKFIGKNLSPSDIIQLQERLGEKGIRFQYLSMIAGKISTAFNTLGSQQV